MRILDLGCGPGCDLLNWGVTGLDINPKSIAEAKRRFPSRTYLLGMGEHMPFPAQCFDRVISGVALPYMNIPKALAEIYRVLVPGGWFSATLHPVSFTVSELRNKAFPKPIPTLFRVYVLGSGVWFHYTGRTLGFVKVRTESFQTERGAKMALTRQHFADLNFCRAPGPVGETLTVTARRDALSS